MDDRRGTLTEEFVRKLAGIERRFDRLVKPEVGIDLISPYLALPALRGFWPMSAVGTSGEALDLSGLGNHLTLHGNPNIYFTDVPSFFNYDGTGDYHDITDAASSNAFDIRGNETYINGVIRGLTLYAWAWFGAAAGSQEFIVSKWGAAGSRAYVLRRLVAGTVNAMVSDDGTNTYGPTSSTAPSQSAWHFYALRFDPSTEVALFVDNQKFTNTTSIPATIFNTDTDFAVAGDGVGSYLLNGRVGPVAVYVADHSDAIVWSVFQRTKAAFRV